MLIDFLVTVFVVLLLGIFFAAALAWACRFFGSPEYQKFCYGIIGLIVIVGLLFYTLSVLNIYTWHGFSHDHGMLIDHIKTLAMG